jgi:hypothetical protein
MIIKLKIIKITDGFVTNSSSFSGVMLIAVKKGKDLKTLLPMIGIPAKFHERFYEVKYEEDYDDLKVEYDDLTDEYYVLEASALLAAYGDEALNGAPPEGEKNPLRWFIEKNDQTVSRKNLIGDDLILLYSMCAY